MPDPKAVMEEFFEAARAMDVDRMEKVLAEDVEFRVESLEKPMRGAAMWSSFVSDARDVIGDLEFDVDAMVASEDEVAVFGRASARFTGDWTVGGETMELEGKDYDVPFAVHARVNDEGKIDRMIRVRDNLPVLRTLDVSTAQWDRFVEAFEREMEDQERAIST